MFIDNFARLNQRAQNTVFAALIVISVVAMYRWLVTPHLKCLFASQQYDYAVDEVVRRNAAVISEISVETKKIKKLSEQFAEYRDKLFTPAQAEEFVGSLQAIFTQAGCTVHSITLVGDGSRGKSGSAGNVSGIAANRATLSISGPYNGIVRLLEGLQNHIPKVWVNSFEMAIDDFASGSLRCDMNITIYTIQDKEAVL